MKKREMRQSVHRLPPCPAYDIEGMESWLSDMAAQGLLLSKDGFFLGVATFERVEPCSVKYRLEAIQKNPSIWTDDGGEPDAEQIELSEKYGWEYVCRRRDFYIYRSFSAQTRELNTDPDVQAMTLNVVKKRRRTKMVSLAIWVVLYPLLFARGLVLTSIHIRTWLFLLLSILVIWMIADEIAALVSLRRIQKRLYENGHLRARKEWRKGAKKYCAKQIANIMLTLTILAILLNNWSASVMGNGLIQIDEYSGTLPFATMRDFAPTEIADYTLTMTGLDREFSTIKQWSDWLAPVCIKYNEHARITLEDGSLIHGGYYMNYYETSSPLIATVLTSEIYRSDMRENNCKLLSIPEIGTPYDALYVYSNNIHIPTILIRNGRQVAKASFFQISGSYTVDLADWAESVAMSLNKR